MNNSIDIGSCSRDYIEYNDQGMNEIPLYSSTSSQPHEINDGHYINLEDQENKFSLAYNNVESQSQEGSSYFSILFIFAGLRSPKSICFPLPVLM